MMASYRPTAKLFSRPASPVWKRRKQLTNRPSQIRDMLSFLPYNLMLEKLIFGHNGISLMFYILFLPPILSTLQSRFPNSFFCELQPGLQLEGLD